MAVRRHVVAFTLAFVALAAFSSAALACKVSRGESAVVAAMADDGTLTLADGRSVKLAGIDLLVRPDASGAGLIGQHVTLHYGVTRIDRYGRALALVTLADGRILQENLVAAGAVRVAPSGDMGLCIGDFLTLEAQARAARLGLWRNATYAIRQADDVAALNRLDGTYQLVEGVVQGVTKVRGRIYINFGADWRTDFTVTVAPAEAKLFTVGAWGKLTGENPALVGAKVRVRGFLSRYNGPGMTIAVPEQIEFLDRKMPEESGKAADEDERNTKKPRRQTGAARQ